MNRVSRRQPFKVEDIPMTPMIDVVFQLLVYFVLTFEIPKAFANLPVYRPGPTLPGTPVAIRIVVAHGAYSFNDTRTSFEDVRDALVQLAHIDKGQKVIIQCTMDSVQQELGSVLDICASTGMQHVSVLTIGE